MRFSNSCEQGERNDICPSWKITSELDLIQESSTIYFSSNSANFLRNLLGKIETLNSLNYRSRGGAMEWVGEVMEGGEERHLDNGEEFSLN